MYGLIHFVDTAELIASGLVSNAVLDAEGPAALRISWSDGVLRIGAWDANPEPPDPPPDLREMSRPDHRCLWGP
jgi:hypothetical protein